MTTTLQPEPRRGEIWWVDFTPSLGAEIQKTRPAVVVNLDGVGRLGVRLVVPLTTWQEKFANRPWMIHVSKSRANGLPNDSAADILQLKAVAIERLRERLGHLEGANLIEVATAIALIVGYETPSP